MCQSIPEEPVFPALPCRSSRGSTPTTCARGTALWESLVGKPRGKDTRENHRCFDPRGGLRDTAATALEESASACPHSRRGLTPLGRLQKYPKIHVSTGEESSGSGPEFTQGLRPRHQRERNSERPPRNSHGDWPFLRPPERVPEGPVPRIDSHHVCTWDSPVESLVGKPRGKDTRENHRCFDPRGGLRDTAATALEESASACPHSRRGLTPLGRLQKYPKIHVSTGEESSGSGPEFTQGLRPRHQRERNSERPPRNSHGDWPFLRPPERVPEGPVPRIDSHHVCTWDSPVESLVGKPRGKDTRENHRCFDPRGGLRDTAATALEESASACPHSRRGLTPLGRLQKYPKIHVSTGEESSGSGPEFTQGLRPRHQRERNSERPPRNSHGDWPFLRPPERVPEGPVGKNSRRSRRISRGGALHRKGERNSRVVPPFQESPRCVSPFQRNLFSLHCLDVQAEDRLPPRVHVGQPCGKASWESLVGKTRGKTIDALIHGADCVTLLLPLWRKARGLTPLGRLQKYPKIHVSTGEESSGSGPEFTQGLRPRHQRERNSERPPRNSHGDSPFLRPPERVPEGPVGKNSRRSRRISRGGALHRKGERNSRVVPPFQESPRCVSPFQRNLFSLHCLDVQAEDRLPPRVHVGQPCGKASWESLVGKTRGKTIDALIHGADCVTLLLPLWRKARGLTPLGRLQKYPKIHVSTGEESSGSGPEFTQGLRPRHQREKNSERPPRNSHGDWPFLRPPERVPEGPVGKNSRRSRRISRGGALHRKGERNSRVVPPFQESPRCVSPFQRNRFSLHCLDVQAEDRLPQRVHVGQPCGKASWGKNSRRSRRISRGGALHRKGERNSRVVPPFQESPRCVSPFQRNRFSLHCLDVQAEDRLPPRVHVGQPCGKASWGKNSRRSRRISRGGALHRKGERNSRVVPPFQESPRCVSPFQRNRFSLHCLDVQAEDRLPPRVHVGQPCGKASWGKNSRRSRRISRGGALHRKGERNSRVVPPFQESPRCVSPFQRNRFSLHCLDVQAEDRLPPRVHVGQPCGKASWPRIDSHHVCTWDSPVGKPRGERIPGVPEASQEEALSTGKARGTPGSCHHSKSPPDVSVHSRGTGFPCTALTFKPRIDSHHVCTWDSPLGKPRGNDTRENHRCFDPRGGLRDTAATALEESASACPHSRRGLTPLGRLQKYPKIHVSTGEESSGSGPEFTQGLRPRHQRERNSERPPRNSHGDWPFLRPPERVPEGPVPRIDSHHVCTWDNPVGKPRGKDTRENHRCFDPRGGLRDTAATALEESASACPHSRRGLTPLGRLQKYPKIHVSTGEESSGSGPEFTQGLRPRHQRERNSERPPRNSHGDWPFLRPPERVPEGPVPRIDSHHVCTWNSPVGKPRGKDTRENHRCFDPRGGLCDTAATALEESASACPHSRRGLTPLGRLQKYPKIHVSTGEESSGSGPEFTQGLRPRHQRERNSERPPRNSHGDWPFLRPPERVPEGPVPRIDSHHVCTWNSPVGKPRGKDTRENHRCFDPRGGLRDTAATALEESASACPHSRRGLTPLGRLQKYPKIHVSTGEESSGSGPEFTQGLRPRHQRERNSERPPRNSHGDWPFLRPPERVPEGPVPRIDSHHVCTWNSPVGKPRGKDTRENHRCFDPRGGLRDTAATALEESASACPHSRRGLTPLGRLQKYPKIHVSTGEESSGSGPEFTQGLRPRHQRERNSERPPRNSHGDWPFLRPPERVPEGPVPRIDSHHVCTWNSPVGKPRGKDTRENHRCFDPRGGLRDTAATALEESASACPHSRRGLTPLGRLQKYPKIHVSTGEESSGSGPEFTQGLRPRHQRERNSERPPRNSHGDWPFLRPPERVPEGPVPRIDSHHVCTWNSPVGKPRGKDTRENHRCFDPRGGLRDTAATALEESASACPHSRRGLTPLGRLQKYPKIHVSTGEESSGSGPEFTQGLRPRHQRERNSERPPRNSHGDWPFLRPPERVPEGPVPRIDSHHVCTWDSPVGKPRGKDTRENHRCFDPRGGLRDTAAAALEESSSACPHSRRGLTPLGRLQKYPKIHVSTGEESSGSGPEFTQGLRPRHQRERNSERPPRNSHGDWPFLRPPERVPEGPVGKNSRRSRRISRGGALHRKGERNSRAVPPFQESPRCVSPFQRNRFSLHCLDVQAEDRLPPRVHVGQPCGKASWESLVGKTRGKTIDALIHGADCVTLLLPLWRKAQVHARIRDED
ncbi:hypothetical protein MJG53_010796 [Ovis ammon polii x Ovis aries]|uniref:Uncharacterized protein n=1 Tax=Ovis ammon polii x Ovis aries TaxID=2918886 RepID=A0ACB9UQJ2_9CETA|nr:hypothetical protein MJG53_010796 [Ovis ammon polii x Ovis aries]